jgi:hypothetical protein
LIRTRAPPTPEPMTLASFETTRTIIFVTSLSPEKEFVEKKRIGVIKIRQKQTSFNLVSPFPPTPVLSRKGRGDSVDFPG